MIFKLKYDIKNDFLKINTKRRSGAKISKVEFITLHDTGNKGSTAEQNVRYYKNSVNDMSVSAHIFVDDKEIIECIPAFEEPEKAWHVLSSKLVDNKIYKGNANDISIAVEYCYGDNIDSQKAYEKYV